MPEKEIDLKNDFYLKNEVNLSFVSSDDLDDLLDIFALIFEDAPSDDD